MEACDAIAFASMKMKTQYDTKHKPKFFEAGDMVRIRLHKGYKQPGISNPKLGPQFAGPVKVIARVGKLAYKLKLRTAYLENPSCHFDRSPRTSFNAGSRSLRST